jgi:predicted protein tyrosine phosphatase
MVDLEIESLIFCANEADKLEKPPSKETVQPLITFAKDIVDEDVVLIHCAMGNNRSPSIGYILNAILLGPNKEQETWDKTLRELYYFDLDLGSKKRKPLPGGVRPNRAAVMVADEMLKREGKLLIPLDAYLQEHFTSYLKFCQGIK